jgi:polyisoprenoid-binding protein YceI
MTRTRFWQLAAVAGLLLLVNVPVERAPAAVPVTEAPTGTYVLDRTHASLIFRVNHLGFSNYTARFTKLDAVLQFDPTKPESMSVTAKVDPSSLETDFPFAEPNFDAELIGPNWLDAGKFPEMTFVSSRIEMVGPRTANVHGMLTLHGVTQPVTLLATFNGGYAVHPMDPGGARIGFSAKTIIERSKFGIAYGIPAPGTTMGVSDAVEAILEVEFSTNKPK